MLSQSSSSTPHSQNQENLEIEHRRSKRARVEKDFSPDYYVFNVENNVIFESSDAIFQKEKFPFKSKNNRCKEVRENVLSQPSSSTSHSQNQENLNIELRRSKRARVEKDFGPDYYVFNVDEILLL